MKTEKITSKNTPEVLLRTKSLFFDWLFICAYLMGLLLLTSIVYFLVLDGIPEFTNLQSQLIATFTSVLPLIIIFSIMEGSNNFASWGKRKADLKVTYKDMPMIRSVGRNILKFLPWQFGHMSTINGIYNGFDTPFSIVFLTLSMTLVLIYVLMAFIRKDNRHLADILSGSKVIKIHRNSINKSIFQH